MQYARVLVENAFPRLSGVPMAKLHSLLAFAFILSTYNNLLLKAKKSKYQIKGMGLISFHYSRQIYYGEMIGLISFHHSRLLHTAI